MIEELQVEIRLHRGDRDDLEALGLEGGRAGQHLLRGPMLKRCPILIYTGSDESEIYGERWEKLRRVVETLPPDQREILHLRYAEGLSRAEIAEILSLEEKLVKSRLFHAMEKLRLHDSLADPG